MCGAKKTLTGNMSERDKSPKRSASEGELNSKLVYVVIQNQDYEGGSVLHICQRREDAEDYARSYASAHSTPHRQFEEVKGGWKCGQTHIEVDEWSVN